MRIIKNLFPVLGIVMSILFIHGSKKADENFEKKEVINVD